MSLSKRPPQQTSHIAVPEKVERADTLDLACLSKSVPTVDEPAEGILRRYRLQALRNGQMPRFMGPGPHPLRKALSLEKDSSMGE
jgi:hypothetical protein